MESQSPTEAALLKDLELQWRDHHHMRDQTWKTADKHASPVSRCRGFRGEGRWKGGSRHHLRGCCGYGSHRLARGEPSPAQAATKVSHDRSAEKQLALDASKSAILREDSKWWRFSGMVFTANFIGWVEVAVTLIAVALLIRELRHSSLTSRSSGSGLAALARR